MTMKFSYFQRRQLRQLVVEAEVMRLTTIEALAHIKENMHEEISQETLFKTKRSIRDSIGPEMEELKYHRTMFLHEYLFKRIYELEKLQREEWKMYRESNNPYVKQNCLSELHKLTVTLLEVSGLIKEYHGNQMYSNEKVISEIQLQQQYQQQQSGYRDPQEQF